ncbi:MAG: hypothetical protein K0R54_5399 [Clostridiaceae bacterium]|jgi:hypothetical protein|nr:hypothetical protein [Clostridiaceae bacterium]
MKYNINYKVNNTLVIINQDKVKGNQINITIKINEKKIASYVKDFHKIIMEIHFNNFVKKFLTNPEYRRSCLISGEWNEIINIEDINYKSEIDDLCKKTIIILNNAGTKKFKDFTNLKTYGKDKFSYMKYEELKLLIDINDIKKIEDIFHDKHLVITAMKWVARGLTAENSIRKVKTDLTIDNNNKILNK